jgi:hypothetical protein
MNNTQAAGKQDLSQHAVKAHVDVWGLQRLKGREQDRTVVVGHCVVHGAGGQTTEVVGFDPQTHRVLTRSGSVYQLGVPNLGFAATNPHLMAQLGFQ